LRHYLSFASFPFNTEIEIVNQIRNSHGWIQTNESMNKIVYAIYDN